MDEQFQTLAEKINDAFFASESDEVTVSVTPEEAQKCFYPQDEGTTDEFDQYLIDQYGLKPLTSEFDEIYMILTIELESVTEDESDDDSDDDSDCPF